MIINIGIVYLILSQIKKNIKLKYYYNLYFNLILLILIFFLRNL